MNLLCKVCELDGEGFHRWKIEVEYKEDTGEKRCKVSRPSYDSYGDYDGHNIIIGVHSEILEDDWKNFLEELRRRKRLKVSKNKFQKSRI